MAPERSFEPPAEFDDYVIVRQLGRGAMGQVYVAEDAVLARQIAIKFLAADPAPAARQRFLMEARAAARIQHPNVVSIYRVGELGDRPYIVSELVRGQPLSELPRPMPWASALALAIDLARGLAAAHRRGVVHCDIKPSNVIVTDERVAKLVDFGLARVLREGAEEAGATMVGTPDYMAPELWGGQPPTRASDVYSMGAVIYELVAGAPPFARTAPDQLGRAVRDGDPPALETDPRLAAIVARCLARSPAERYPSGEELREALERLSASRGQLGRLGDNPYRGLRPFEATHRGVFFGRGLEVSAIVDRLRTDSVVVVAGDSGIGKSSLCKAGVVPAIVDGALGGDRVWRTLAIVPGRRPLAALGAALEDPGLAARLLEEPELLARELHRRAGSGGLVLLVDQMEELVTVGDPVEVAAFDAALARLSEGAAGVRLITTVRSDLLSRIVALPRFGQELARVLYFVRPLPPERLRDVIVGPAAATDVRFESEEMITELVDTTARAGGGGLPLLSFALAELWEARDRDRGLITQATLDRMGGVAGALSRHADSVLAGMTAADRPHARHVLLRLITSLGTRARRTEAELTVGEHTHTALAALVAGRLLVVHDGEGGATYELAHEVLVRGWGTLRDWLDADAEERTRRERLAEACAEWQRLGRRRDGTWRGRQLAEALALDEANLSTLEREFVAASARAARHRRWLRRGITAGVLVLGLAVYAISRQVAASRLADEVDVAIAAARGELDAARAASRAQHALAGAAFAKFDAGDRDAGEVAWQATLAQRMSAGRAYRAAARGVEAALAKDPTRADVRALLGDILVERTELAELVRDPEIQDELESRIEAYDADGSRRARLARPGHVVVRAQGAPIWVDGTLVGTGLARLDLRPGAHTIETRAPVPITTAVLVERDATVELDLAPPPVAPPPAYVYVPTGAFLYGSAADEEARRSFLTTVPLHPRTTLAFMIARHEVTFGEYLAFVDALPAGDRAARLPHVPISPGAAGVVVERSGDGWQLVLQPMSVTSTAAWGNPVRYAGRPRREAQDWRMFPVLGISALDAEAYTTWLDRTGKLPGARLCTELEWEHAARGVDGRDSPTGRTLAPDDANLDDTYGARELMGPDAVGSHPGSVSPFGLFDTAGNAFEWTTGERPGTYVARGGSFWHDRKTANLANRNESTPALRDATLGMRVCASVRR